MGLLRVFSYEHPFYPIHIITNVIFTTLLVVFSSVTTMIANETIQGALALSDTQSIWLTTLNLLGINTVVPTSTWFARRFGYNRMYTVGILIFTISTLIVACSQNFLMIAIGRFVEGVGGGFIFPLGLGLVTKSVSKDKLGLAISLYMGISFGLGLGLGICSAGIITQFFSWRLLFIILLPLALLSTISCWLARPAQPETHDEPFDFFGFITFATFVSSLLVALTLGPIKSTNQGWKEPYIIALFIIAAISLISCILIERKHPDPLFPLELLQNPLFSVSLIAMFLIGAAIFSSITISIKYMIIGLKYEKNVVGVIASTYGFAFGIFSMLSNVLSKKIPIPILTFTGLSLLIFSYFLNNELSILTGYSQLVVLLVLRGAGIGLALSPTTELALSGLEKQWQGSGATILTFFRQVGGTYGSTLLSLVSIRRTIFHTSRFAERVNPSLPGYKKTFQALKEEYNSPAYAKALIIENIETQAFIQGLNDAFIFLAYLTIGVGVLFFIFLIRTYYKTRQVKVD